MAKKDYKKVGYFRSFLNKPYHTSTSSCISYLITTNTYNKELKKKNLHDTCNIEFTMSDCTRNISLDFSVFDKPDFDNSIHKLDTIIKGCKKMKKDLDKTFKVVQKGKKEALKLKEKKNG